MDFRKARLQIILAAVLGIVLIGGIAYLSILITKNTLPINETGRRGGYAIFTPQSKEFTGEYAKEEWVTYGGDYYNRRYSGLTDVNLGTIQDLQPAWATDLGPGVQQEFLGEAVPIVVDHMMYVATGLGNVVALHANTGEKAWTYESDMHGLKEEGCCGRTTRSVAVAAGKVYIGRPDAKLVALDQKTGEVLWEKEVADAKQGYHITSAPLYYNEKIYIGVSGGKTGVTGSLIAIDAKDGRDVWSFDGIPIEKNKVSSSNSVNESQEQIAKMEPIWNTPAIDTKSGIVYFTAGYTTGEPTNQAEKNSLHALLIVAVDAKTGAYEWHFQDDNREKWSIDASNPVVLFEVEHNGEKKKALGLAGNQGLIYLLDRENGVPLFEKEEQSAFQWEKADSVTNDPTEKSRVSSLIKTNEQNGQDGSVASLFTPFWDLPELQPSLQKTSNWMPSAYSPKTEYYYMLEEQEVGKSKSTHMEDMMDIAGIKEKAAMAGTGILTAVDVKTNEIAWQVNWQHTDYTSLLATAGDIIFAGSGHGRVSALHAATGQEVWSYETGADSNTPAVTYEIDGVQYIAILAVEKTLVGDIYRQKMYAFALDGAWDGIQNNASAEEIQE